MATMPGKWIKKLRLENFSVDRMDLLILVLNASVVFIITIIGLLFRFYLPNYLKKKGENLATKEDVQEITRLTESVKEDFKLKFEDYAKDRDFKYQYYYDQFCILYSELYSIVAQSEYLRRFLKLHEGLDFSFEDEPFIEISPTVRIDTKITMSGGTTSAKSKEKLINDSISEFNKKALFEAIIKKGEYASQKLLKLAVAYRFVHKHYAGTDPTSDAVETANSEECILIREIILCIIMEYNFLREELRLPHSESELETGIFEKVIVSGE